MNNEPQSPNQVPGMWAGIKLCAWSKDLLKVIRQELAPNGWRNYMKKTVAVVPAQWFLTKEKVDKVAYLALVRATVLKEAVKQRINRDKDVAESQLAAIMVKYGNTNPIWFWKRARLEREARELTHLRDVLTGIVFHIDQLGPRTEAVSTGTDGEVDPLEEGTGKSPVIQSTDPTNNHPARGAGDDYPVEKERAEATAPAPGTHDRKLNNYDEFPPDLN